MPKQYPQQAMDNLPEEFISETITSLRQLADKGKPKDNAELRQRIDDYFFFCEKSGLRPGVESLSLALSVTRKTFYEWQCGRGCDSERQRIILKAKSFLASFWEQSMLRGKLNPASAIFIAKNWFNYKDTMSFEDLTDNQTAPWKLTMTPQEVLADIKRRHGIHSLDDIIDPDDIRPDFAKGEDADEPPKLVL